MTTMTVLNTVNAYNTDDFVAHKDGCRDLRKELRQGGVFVEATGITDLEAYMQTNYGFEAGYGDQPGDGWHASHVNRKPCTR